MELTVIVFLLIAFKGVFEKDDIILGTTICMHLELVSYVHLFDNCSQDSFAVYAILVDLLKNAKAVKPQITGALLRSDGKGCYHSNTLIAPLHCIYELSGIKPLR